MMLLFYQLLDAEHLETRLHILLLYSMRLFLNLNLRIPTSMYPFLLNVVSIFAFIFVFFYFWYVCFAILDDHNAVHNKEGNVKPFVDVFGSVNTT